jgi:hypothetical protein
MGTRADFYVGRGENAEWLGSIAWDGYPDGIETQLLNCTGEAAYRHAVAEFLKEREDKSLPEDGWPWPWDDSNTTDFAYAFDGEKVYGSCFGSVWFDPTKEALDENDERIPADNPPRTPSFPSMKDGKRRPIFGKHSGVIVIGG